MARRTGLLLIAFLFLIIPVIPAQQEQAGTSAEPLTGDNQTIRVDAAAAINSANSRRFRQTHLWSMAYGVETHEHHDIPYVVPGLFGTKRASDGYGELRRCLQDSSSATALGGQYCVAIVKVSDQPGMSLGNYGGWMSTGLLHLRHFTSYAGISQTIQIQHQHTGIGDSSMIYGYPLCSGGTTAPSDEGCAHFSSDGGQYSTFFSGRFQSNVVTGQTVFPDFDKKSGTCYDTADAGSRYCYGQGEYLIDSSAPVARGNILSAATETAKGPALMAVEPANLTPSPTWGYIEATAAIPKPETPDLPRPSPALTVTLSNGPGFTAGDPVCFMGNTFPENSTVLSASPVAAGKQTITLSLRKPEPKGRPHFVYKALACGQLSPSAEEKQTGWPAGYFAVPVDAGHLAWAFYSFGSRSGIAPPFDPKGRYAESHFVLPVQNRPVSLKRDASGAVLVSARGTDTALRGFAHLPNLSISGCEDASLNETVSNPTVSADLTILSYQSAVKSKASCNTAILNVAGANSYSLYYGAEIVATSDPDSPGKGTTGYIQVEQNRIPWQGGHLAKVGHSESFNGTVFHIDQNQLTPGNGLTGSGAILRALVRGNFSSCGLCIDNYVPANHYAGLGGWQPLPSFLGWKGPIGTVNTLEFAPQNFLYAGHSADYPNGSPNEPDYLIFALRGYQQDATLTVSPSAFNSSTKPSWTFTGAGQFKGNVTAANFNGILAAVTPTIGGSALTAGTCASGSVTVQGAQPGQPVAVSATDGSLPLPMVMLSAAVVTPNTVKVQLCAVAQVTPPAKPYNVRVIQ